MNIIELDAASNNGVDDMRALTDQVMMPPSTGRYRVFIVDEVHMLTSAAFNAFLKTLEEPPHYAIFILATTEKHRIIPTILSRCQIYDFRRISVADIAAHLASVAAKENISAEPQALNVIARKADGAMRDALSIFDQVAASSRGNITYRSAIENLNVLDADFYNRLLDCFLEGKVLDSWVIFKEITDRGFDPQFFINGLAAYLRDLMVAQNPKTLHLIDGDDEERRAKASVASRCTPGFLCAAMSLCNDADLNYRESSAKNFLIELTLAKICQLSSPSPLTRARRGALIAARTEAHRPSGSISSRSPTGSYTCRSTHSGSTTRTSGGSSGAPATCPTTVCDNAATVRCHSPGGRSATNIHTPCRSCRSAAAFCSHKRPSGRRHTPTRLYTGRVGCCMGRICRRPSFGAYTCQYHACIGPIGP